LANRLAVPQPTEWQGIGDQIDAAMIFARTDFVNVYGTVQRTTAFITARIGLSKSQ
jgi:hypothetical protein